MNKEVLLRIVFWLIMPFIFVFVSYSIYLPHQKLTLMPATAEGKFDLHTYCDSVKTDTNASKILWYKSTDSVLAFSYMLGEGYSFPFAGISLFAKKNFYFDISSYSTLDLTIEATKGKRVQLFLGTFATGFTKPEVEMTYRYLTKDLDLEIGKQSYSIPIQEFGTATWWYADNHISEKEMSAVEYDKIKIINIQNCQLLGKNIEDVITIKALKFSKDIKSFYFFVVGILVFYFMTVALLFYLKRKPKSQIHKVEINYVPVSTGNQFENELQKIVLLISSEYSDAEFSLKKIQLELGLPENKIASLIKESFNLSFKQYLNQLRLSEAKRILLETDLPVSDIAYKVGYGNISHFNRVFKEAEGIPPNDFRKKRKL